MKNVTLNRSLKKKKQLSELLSSSFSPTDCLNRWSTVCICWKLQLLLATKSVCSARQIPTETSGLSCGTSVSWKWYCILHRIKHLPHSSCYNHWKMLSSAEHTTLQSCLISDWGSSPQPWIVLEDFTSLSSFLLASKNILLCKKIICESWKIFIFLYDQTETPFLCFPLVLGVNIPLCLEWITSSNHYNDNIFQELMFPKLCDNLQTQTLILTPTMQNKPGLVSLWRTLVHLLRMLFSSMVGKA